MGKPAYWDVSPKVVNYQKSGFLWEVFLHSIEHNARLHPTRRKTQVTKADYKNRRIESFGLGREIHVVRFIVKLDHCFLNSSEMKGIVKSVESSLRSFLKKNNLDFAWPKKHGVENCFRDLRALGLHTAKNLPACGIVKLREGSCSVTVDIISKRYWDFVFPLSRKKRVIRENKELLKPTFGDIDVTRRVWIEIARILRIGETLKR